MREVISNSFLVMVLQTAEIIYELEMLITVLLQQMLGQLLELYGIQVTMVQAQDLMLIHLMV